MWLISMAAEKKRLLINQENTTLADLPKASKRVSWTITMIAQCLLTFNKDILELTLIFGPISSVIKNDTMSYIIHLFILWKCHKYHLLSLPSKEFISALKTVISPAIFSTNFSLSATLSVTSWTSSANFFALFSLIELLGAFVSARKLFTFTDSSLNCSYSIFSFSWVLFKRWESLVSRANISSLPRPSLACNSFLNCLIYSSFSVLSYSVRRLTT